MDELRHFYSAPKNRAVMKQLPQLERHSIHFIELAPFVVLSTVGQGGQLDASPRGGEPGFVKVVDEQTIAIPDFKGNNRLDSLENIVSTGRIGLLFMIPGVDETLRINGRAKIGFDEDLLSTFDFIKVPPKTYIEVSIEDVFLHCAKALMRSQLWESDKQFERSQLPTMGEMLNDQIEADSLNKSSIESQADMVKRYQSEL